MSNPLRAHVIYVRITRSRSPTSSWRERTLIRAVYHSQLET